MEDHLRTLGWREWVSLPELGVEWIKAKVDTGARSSSLHAVDIEQFDGDGGRWVRFVVAPWQRSDLDSVTASAPLHETREVKSSSGDSQIRPVIRTIVRIDGINQAVDMTITDRADMGFRMLLGREAIRRRFLVNPGRSYRAGKPPRAIRARNREQTP